MNANDIQEVEITIEQAHAQIRLGELAQELQKVPAYKELITEFYFCREASRLVMLKTDMAFQTAERQHALETDLVGISSLAAFMRNTILIGGYAKESLDQHLETLDELREEA